MSFLRTEEYDLVNELDRLNVNVLHNVTIIVCDPWLFIKFCSIGATFKMLVYIYISSCHEDAYLNAIYILILDMNAKIFRVLSFTAISVHTRTPSVSLSLNSWENTKLRG